MSIGQTLTSLGIRAMRTVSKYSPEILMIVGTAGVVSGTVIAAKQTLKVEEELSDIREKQDELKEYKDRYTEKEYKKELFQIKKGAALKLVQIYGPSVMLIGGGITCYFSAFGIMKKRQGVLVASLAAANKAFEAYRARVIEDQGKEKDKEYLYGLKKEKLTTTEVDENGKKKKVTEDVYTQDGANISRYAVRFTPEFATEASTDVNYNASILKSTEASFNALLKSRKKIYLNEVYHELGIDETYESRIVGWDYNNDNHGDGKIHFDITQIVEWDSNDPLGYHKELIVDFNVDGDIAHRLPKNPAFLGMEVEDHIIKADRVNTIG